MDIRLERERLLRALARVQSVLEKKGSMAILSYVSIEAQDQISLKASNLQISYDIALSGEILSPGNVVLPGKKLYDIIRESKGKIFSITKSLENLIRITDGKTDYTLHTIDYEEFPFVGASKNLQAAEITYSAFSKAITKGSIAAATDENFPHLAGVSVHRAPQEGNVRFASADNFRFALQEITMAPLYQILPENGILIPRRAIPELIKFDYGEDEILTSIQEKNLTVSRPNDTLLVIMLKDYQFVDYTPLLEYNHIAKAIIDKNILQDALKRMYVFSEDPLKDITMIFNEKDSKEMTLSINIETGQAVEKIPVEFEGDQFEIHFEPKQILDTLQVMESEKIHIFFTGETSACTITGVDDKGFLSVIMPYA